MEPSIVPAVILAVVVVGLALAVLAALAVERPDPAETLVAYEEAWDRLDFDLLWRLNAQEMREGLGREAFVEAKQAVYHDGAGVAGLVERVEIADLTQTGRHAAATTRVLMRDGTRIDNRVRLRREGNRWFVVSYRLDPRAPGQRLSG